MGVRVFAADIDKKSLFFAKELYPTVRFAVCNAEDASFKTNSFDKVLCTEVLEHIENDDKAFQELARMIKPGGLILISVPSIKGIFGSFVKEIGHRDGKGFEKHYRKGYSIEAIKKLIDRNELRLLRYNYTMTFFTEFYMGLTKLAYLLLKKDQFKSQCDFKNLKDNSFMMRLNKMLLPLFLKIGILEDKILSNIIKGHMLILLCTKK